MLLHIINFWKCFMKNICFVWKCVETFSYIKVRTHMIRSTSRTRSWDEFKIVQGASQQLKPVLYIWMGYEPGPNIKNRCDALWTVLNLPHKRVRFAERFMCVRTLTKTREGNFGFYLKKLHVSEKGIYWTSQSCGNSRRNWSQKLIVYLLSKYISSMENIDLHC